MSQGENLPLEKRFIEGLFNGRREKIPAIDVRWTKEENRVFSIFPRLPIPEDGVYISGEDKTWLEVARFVQDDLQWLLSLEHHKFWSHMIHTEKARSLLVSFLSECPPEYLKSQYLVDEEVRSVFQDIERLVFLVFLRLSTVKESESCFIKNLGEILYNNYLFTVPIILDICLIYGASNLELVKKMVNEVIMLEPRFLNDFKEIVPHFFQVLTVVRDNFFPDLFKVKEKTKFQESKMRDLIFYLHDSVSTIQIFLSLCPKGCKLFFKCECVIEIVSFYSNELPKMYETWEQNISDDPLWMMCGDLIEKTRLDFLKTVKSLFDAVGNDSKKFFFKKDELVDEYLNMMLELLSESAFLSDYNLLYSIEYEIGLLTQDCTNVDTVKINHILEGVQLAENSKEAAKDRVNNKNLKIFEASPESESASAVKLNSLVTEIKDILPHLADGFVRECLKFYKNNTEHVIAAVLENSLPSHLQNWDSEKASETSRVRETHNSNDHNEGFVAHKGKRREYESLNEMLQDKTELNELKERYVQLALVETEAYDDEYDDTYDENLSLAIREEEETEKGLRPFVVPRVLRPAKENEDTDDFEEGSEEEDEKPKRDCFVPNPAELREQRERKRQERIRRDVVGRGRGQGQSKEVLHNRDYKGAHKSSMANHNRKKQASRKKNQGMIPF